MDGWMDGGVSIDCVPYLNKRFGRDMMRITYIVFRSYTSSSHTCGLMATSTTQKSVVERMLTEETLFLPHLRKSTKMHNHHLRLIRVAAAAVRRTPSSSSSSPAASSAARTSTAQYYSTHNNNSSSSGDDPPGSPAAAASPPPPPSSSSSSQYLGELRKLEGVRELRLHQTRTIEKKILPQASTVVLKGGGLVRSEMTVTDRTSSQNHNLLYTLEFSRGVVFRDFNIRLMSTPTHTNDTDKKKITLALLFLKRSVSYRALVLRIRSPPDTRYASVYELPGISKVAIIKCKKESKCFTQLLANGPLGWATHAKILSGDGSSVIGEMVKVRRETEKLLTAHISLHNELTPIHKICVIGGAVALMCRYQF